MYIQNLNNTALNSGPFYVQIIYFDIFELLGLIHQHSIDNREICLLKIKCEMMFKGSDRLCKVVELRPQCCRKLL